jgi:hypothetical protein
MATSSRSGSGWSDLGRVRATTAALLLGVGLVAFAVWRYVDTTRFLADAERTTGTVVEVVERTQTREDDQGNVHTSRLWHPIVSFTADGQTVEFESDQGSRSPAYDVGDSVTVAYDPERPSGARIVNDRLQRDPLMFGAIGAAFLAGGGIARVVGWTRRRRLQ